MKPLISLARPDTAPSQKWSLCKSLDGWWTTTRLKTRRALQVLLLLSLTMVLLQTMSSEPAQARSPLAAKTSLSQSSTYYNSDIVDLDHCDLSARQEILKETENLLQKAVDDTQLSLNQSVQALFDSESNNALRDNRTFVDYQDDMRDEFALQLLELKLMERGMCNYSLFRPTVPGHQAQGLRLQHVANQLQYQHQPTLWNPFRRVPIQYYRLAIVISAFQDFNHLVALLRAVHLPQNYIVIHIDRYCDHQYQSQLEDLLATTPHYSNVVIVQFGSVVYTSDTISLINLRILRWLTFDLQLDYEQVLLIDAAVYPLRSPQEMVDYLQVQSTQHNRSVWLGLLHFGKRFDFFDYESGQRPAPDTKYMQSTRLVSTRNFKLFKENLYWKNLPSHISNLFIYKATSGNQGVYSRSVVEKLLSSDIVMELFAWSKYSCCCCVEERNWMAALDAIGHAAEAIQYTSMFQVWGGSKRCVGSMSNAVLSTDPSLHYISADPFHYNKETRQPKQFCFGGNETLSVLASAKERGALFARKFRSHSAESVSMMQEIESKLWQQNGGFSAE
jgi:hypothetical protein